MRRKILFVDDSNQVLRAIRRMLRSQRHGWEMTFMADPRKAWAALLEMSFDLVVSDVNMPHLHGLDLLERIKNNEATRHIPVVMLTGLGDRNLKREALDRGAADLLGKPVEPEDLVARIQSVLRLKVCEDQLKDQNLLLERKVQERTAELERSRMEVIWRLGKAAEYRDNETGNHIVRVGCMSREIARSLGMEHDFIETLFVAAPLHDIGKIGIPDVILLKEGPFSEVERQVMMRHCRIGERILKADPHAERYLPGYFGTPAMSEDASIENPLIDMAATIALTHHEKWNGTGYPQGLAGEAIPLESRITAVADVFDALTSRRSYKPAFEEDKALAIMCESVGTHFDPEIYEAFERALPEIRHIRTVLADGARHPESEHTTYV